MAGYINGIFVLDNVLWTLVSGAVSILVASMMFKVFSNRPNSKNPDDIAGFFPLSDLLSSKGLRTFAAFFSVPFALLVFVVCLQSSAFVVAIERLMETYVLQAFNASIRDQLQALMLKIPPYLYPVFIFAVVAALFAPKLRGPVNWFRDLVFLVAAIDSRAEHLALRAAHRAQTTIGITEATKRLAAIHGDPPPLPPELSQVDLVHQLAFRLIQFASDRTGEVGLDDAIAEVLQSIGVQLEPDGASRILVKTNLSAAVVFYLVICGLYVFLSPLIGGLIVSSSFASAFLHPIYWAKDHNFLMTQLAQTSLSFVIPLAIGINAFDIRRAGTGSTESMLRTFIWVFQIVFLISLFVNVVFAIISSARFYTQQNSGNPFLFGDEKFIADIFFTSLAPAGGLLAWVVTRRLRAPVLVAAAFVCTASGLSLFICEYGYEQVCNNIIGFYWHQLFLGAVIVSAYFFAASMVGEVRGAPSDGKLPQVPAPAA